MLRRLRRERVSTNTGAERSEDTNWRRFAYHWLSCNSDCVQENRKHGEGTPKKKVETRRKPEYGNNLEVNSHRHKGIV